MEKKRAKVTLHEQIKEKQRMMTQLLTGQQERGIGSNNPS